MKPTQQEIIELAREAHRELVTIDYPGHIAPLDPWTMRLCERFAALLLERFGAGGGEPSRDMPHGWVTNWPALNGGTRPVYHASAIKPKYGPELDNSLVSYPVFTRPGSSPTDLRAEYLRGLEDAAKVADAKALTWRVKPVPLLGYSAELEECAAAIRALKGKQ